MPDPLLFGAIADDYTGAADLASMLREQGVRTGLLFGTDQDELVERLSGYQALVIALKFRSAPVDEARAEALRALDRLRSLGARQVHFKYCSTFDSTPQGNIGPVTDALMTALETAFTVAVPALPVNGRTQYLGHLFVGDRLLSESHMRHHPLTPMCESNLVRHLQAQTERRVGLISHPIVREGPEAIRSGIGRLESEGIEVALMDAISLHDLRSIGEAVADLPLTTGGSGLGMTLPEVWARRGELAVGALEARMPGGSGGCTLVVAGSCSAVTLSQLEALRDAGGEGERIDVLHLLADEAAELQRLLARIELCCERQGWGLVYSSAGPDERERLLRAASQGGTSATELSQRLERATGELVRRAVAAGSIGSVIVAGGETTGAVAQALGLGALEVGPALDPGVPVARSIGTPSLDVVFKSGNFGGADFFLKALRYFGVEPDSRPDDH